MHLKQARQKTPSEKSEVPPLHVALRASQIINFKSVYAFSHPIYVLFTFMNNSEAT